MASPLLTTLEERQLGILHDAVTPGYSVYSEEEFVRNARKAGCDEKVIAAALCFARPKEGWSYDDWISFLMRDDLTRLVKAADSEAALAHFHLHRKISSMLGCAQKIVFWLMNPNHQR